MSIASALATGIHRPPALEKIVAPGIGRGGGTFSYRTIF